MCNLKAIAHQASIPDDILRALPDKYYYDAELLEILSRLSIVSGDDYTALEEYNEQQIKEAEENLENELEELQARVERIETGYIYLKNALEEVLYGTRGTAKERKDSAKEALDEAVFGQGNSAPICYDNNGNTIDRYTIFKTKYSTDCVASGISPRVFWQHTTGKQGQHLGKLVNFWKLPEAVKNYYIKNEI